jgi:hypothetical protein
MNTDEHGLKRSIHGLRYVEEKGANPLPHLCDHPPTVSPVVWQRFSGNPATNAGNFHQALGQPVGRAAFFRLSTGSPLAANRIPTQANFTASVGARSLALTKWAAVNFFY